MVRTIKNGSDKVKITLCPHCRSDIQYEIEDMMKGVKTLKNTLGNDFEYRHNYIICSECGGEIDLGLL